jgi:hypothetical protein
MNTDSAGRRPVLLRFALGPRPISGFSPWKGAVWNGSYLSPSVWICGGSELLRLSPKVRVVLEPEGAELGSRVAESPIPCRKSYA